MPVPGVGFSDWQKYKGSGSKEAHSSLRLPEPFSFHGFLIRLRIRDRSHRSARESILSTEPFRFGTMLIKKAYMAEAEFAMVLIRLGANEVALRDNCDAALHLVTAAKGARTFFTAAINAARTEAAEEVAALDDMPAKPC